jgi:PAS domain S-box-containing protein
MRISLLYFVAGSLWIIGKDRLLSLIADRDVSILISDQVLKPWLFILVVSGLLYALLRHEFNARERSEKLALDREARFRDMFVYNPLPMLVYDRETLCYIDVNEAACAHYGYTHDEFLQLKVMDIRPPEDVPRLLAFIADHNSGFRDAGEWRHKTKDGRAIDVAVSALALDFSGRPAVLTVIRDLTEQKRSEAERIENEKLRLMLAKESELQAMRGRFTSMVSHEFRRPLTTVTTTIELIEHYRSRMDDTTVQKHFTRLHEQLDEMKELLDDFLALMRAESAPRELKLKQVDLVELCSRLVEELRLTAANTHQLHFNSTCTGMIIEADEKLLRQAISNLLTNAIKYSPSGSLVKVTLGRSEDIELHVIDQGIGIPQQEQARIFEPFFRANNVGDLSGTGLGLPIARQAAELHGGTLAVARSDASGTDFLMRLPLNERVFLTGC